MDPTKLLFPHETIRPIQEDLIKDIKDAIENKKNIIAHAPTGLGKTASSLPIALSYAIENDLTVFFLTSRHTQHEIAIETLRQVKKKYQTPFSAIDLIGKQWMCSADGVKELYSNEFSEYCKAVREEGKCEFYNNTKKNVSGTIKTKKILAEIKDRSVMDSEEMINICKKEKLCPYEIAMMAAKKAKVIIADYYYIFHPTIRDTFMQKTARELKNCIIIIDEAHNLPKRTTDLMTDKISSFILDSAIKEADKFGFEETKNSIEKIKKTIESFSDSLNEKNNEKTIKKEEFIKELENYFDYDLFIENTYDEAELVREKQKRSFIGSVSSFLESWKGDDTAFTRILSLDNTRRNSSITLTYRCLDPSLMSKDIIKESHSTIMMSATLTPTKMYKDLMGFDNNTIMKEYPSPFPKENRLNLIIPETTTKYTARNEEQYRRIAKICSDITNSVPGNSAIFFPSYYLRDQVERFLIKQSNKSIFSEIPKLTREKKQEMLQKFENYKDKGAILTGVASGSFSQGIDFKGDMLKAVIVVGIPLNRPDLETKKIIEYYDKKFHNGMQYGYFFPAMTKCIQSAGRCIRSETDKGAIIFLDERFAWQNYKSMFPKEWDIRTTRMYQENIDRFFKK